MTRNAHNEELARAQAALRASGCDAALLSSLANVTYVSGYEVPPPLGAGSEFSYGIPLALITVDSQSSTLIVPDGNLRDAQAQHRLANLVSFATFDGFQPTDPKAAFLSAVRDVLQQAGLAHATATLGIEFRYLPYAVAELLESAFPRLTLVDAGDALQQARLIKTEREIQLLRRAVQVADFGQETLSALVQQAGQSEFEMWSAITRRMEQAVGHSLIVVGELVTGPRTTVVEYPNGPRPRITQAGDGALMDISQRIDGYWSDCSNAHVIAARPTAEQQRYLRASQAACEAAMAALRPGALASDAWQAAEAAFQSYGLTSAHYAGHQIGVTVNEQPRLVPYDHTPIQAGMVFAVEPGVYQGPGGTFGARSEKMVLVTESGPEILSQFAWGITES